MPLVSIDGQPLELDDIVAWADAGDIDALCFLGDIYTSGQYGIAAEPAKGWNYYKLAVKAGSAAATYKLGRGYVDGQAGLPLDDQVGSRLIEQAADAGDGDAQYWLGLRYAAAGQPARAADYFDLAARDGHTKAQYQLGQYWFFTGKNIDNAIYWLCLSYHNGDSDAWDALNAMITQGNVPRAYERIQSTLAQIQGIGQAGP